ncbi:MAG: hypothetical protein HZC02_00360 [Candidatus Levybacteria bacterium]|nr:hypothetical protein [Candidatus Levybacteria bacterium]
MKKLARKIRYSYRSLPDKKQYVEFFTALLTVPVLLTVIILNLNNLKGNQKANAPTATPEANRPIFVTVAKGSDESPSPTPQNTVCKKGIGPIAISSPEEGDVISESPIQVSINYQQEDFCSVVWAYRINNGRFSDYDDRSIALFNPPKGTINFQLKVKSIVTGEEKILNRTFTYNGSNIDTQNSASTSGN